MLRMLRALNRPRGWPPCRAAETTGRRRWRPGDEVGPHPLDRFELRGKGPSPRPLDPSSSTVSLACFALALYVVYVERGRFGDSKHGVRHNGQERRVPQSRDCAPAVGTHRGGRVGRLPAYPRNLSTASVRALAPESAQEPARWRGLPATVYLSREPGAGAPRRRARRSPASGPARRAPRGRRLSRRPRARGLLATSRAVRAPRGRRGECWQIARPRPAWRAVSSATSSAAPGAVEVASVRLVSVAAFCALFHALYLR